jgi:hypothetical protein
MCVVLQFNGYVVVVVVIKKNIKISIYQISLIRCPESSLTAFLDRMYSIKKILHFLFYF